VRDPLRHHGDVEATPGLVDLAVNVHPAGPPSWLRAALTASLDDLVDYPSPVAAEAAVAARHGRSPDEVLATAGAAEAFTLLARLCSWRRPVVVHPQFTEPHAALVTAGRTVTKVVLPPPFILDPALLPDDADLVVLGNPTNPTGVLHPVDTIRALLAPGRLVVVDEAFMDAVPGEPQSLTGFRDPGLIVVRSLTKHWSIPGLRCGYLLGDPSIVDALRAMQVPWSVSTPAAAALVACMSDEAAVDAEARAHELQSWRAHLEDELTSLGIPFIASQASFVLAEVGDGVHARLRAAGVAVRRGDTFPGLGPTWVRIAARPPEAADALVRALRPLIREISAS
jgi:histidinol-phosphate/aromatic aminotransferase/cobyric acid decarboxylase-like protein